VAQSGGSLRCHESGLLQLGLQVLLVCQDVVIPLPAGLVLTHTHMSHLLGKLTSIMLADPLLISQNVNLVLMYSSRSVD